MGLINRLEGVRLRRIDIPTWDCPIAKAHSIDSLPTLWLYDDGRRVSTGTQDVLRKLLERAGR